MASSLIDWTTWEPKTPATLMFIVRDGRILLIEKKRGHGAGKVNGPGGKIDPGETSLQAAIRETQEELGITPIEPRKVGELWFAMSDVPDILCHVYRAEAFAGEPVETEEAVPLWASLNEIPYDRMWVDDVMWLPLLIEGIGFRGRFVFEEEAMLSHEMETGLVWDHEFREREPRKDTKVHGIKELREDGVVIKGEGSPFVPSERGHFS